MNRTTYWNLCEQRLATLCTRIELRGKLNILDFHLHAEDFYMNFLNLLFELSLRNMNAVMQNVEGIDLIDDVNKLVLQVSSTATRNKIESALAKNLQPYSGYSFNFVSISKDASELRKQTFANPHKLDFSPSKDIYDVKSILNSIQHLSIEKQRVVYAFLKKELQPDEDRPLMETNLAEVINILAKEAFDIDQNVANPIAFNIDNKLAFNNLVAATAVIENYKVQHHRIEKIYTVFDSSGQNKSRSVLESLRNSYLKLSAKYTRDELFFEVIEQAIKKVQGSANFSNIPLEELEIWINALVVDAFIRCKIFENPGGLNAAA